MTGFRRSFSWYGGPSRIGNFNAMMTSWRHSVMNAPLARSLALFFLLCLLLGAFLSTRFLADPSSSVKSGSSSASATLGMAVNSTQNSTAGVIPKQSRKKIEIPLNCTALNKTNTCPRNYPTKHSPLDEDGVGPTCPEYFRWIYEDLRPWNGTGITRAALESGRRTANFRLVVLNGRVYVEQFQKSFQSRDVFTIWGILQLLRKYPGKVPDLELMFDCVDWPVILKKFYNGLGPDSVGPPPLFRYCANDATLDIVFPDWSFWGWPEINIKPWDSLLKDLEEGNKRTKWIDREHYAYWKGNPAVAATREDLMKCNVSEGQDWSVRVFAQDWIRESQEGYKQSDLASQCIHRYKIYIEGSAWSVSEKYILACDSVTLVVKPHYYDFFTRGLLPVHHYWPIREDDKCRSLKFAVDWGNRHKQKAQEIGKAASKFIQEDLKMEYVYDYMFHLLNEYAKLLRFKPEVPENATELCSESMACSTKGLDKKFMMESLVMGPSDRSPCTMAIPYDAHSLYALKRKKGNIIKNIELWEKQFWEKETGQQ